MVVDGTLSSDQRTARVSLAGSCVIYLSSAYHEGTIEVASPYITALIVADSGDCCIKSDFGFIRICRKFDPTQSHNCQVSAIRQVDIGERIVKLGYIRLIDHYSLVELAQGPIIFEIVFLGPRVGALYSRRNDERRSHRQDLSYRRRQYRQSYPSC